MKECVCLCVRFCLQPASDFVWDLQVISDRRGAAAGRDPGQEGRDRAKLEERLQGDVAAQVGKVCDSFPVCAQLAWLQAYAAREGQINCV